MISIIHPSRRPKQAIETANKWVERIGLSQDEFEYVLSVDNDDPFIEEYQLPDVKYKTIIKGDNKSAIQAINRAASYKAGQREDEGGFLIVISDDFSCPKNWGVFLAEIVAGRKDWILKTMDGIQDWLITLPIMDWVYYRRFNYVYHPDYQHAFCDTEMTIVAELLDRKITSGILFQHNHYSITGIEKDEVSEKADSTFNYGKITFVNRGVRDFDIPSTQIVGQLTPSVYAVMIGEAKLKVRGVQY